MTPPPGPARADGGTRRAAAPAGGRRIPAAKEALRAAAGERRARAHARLRRTAGAALADHFLASLSGRVVRGGTAALYWPMRTEIDVRPLLEALAAAGMRTALPVADGPGSPLAFAPWRPGAPLRRHRFGMLEPAAGAPVRPDLVIVPLLAFDRTGARLGYGGGCYDRTLCRLRGQGPVFAAGAAYAEQEHGAVPAAPHDARLDAVVTERGPVPVDGPRP